MSNKREEIKKVVEELINTLSQRGVKVTDAAILNLDSEKKNEAMEEAFKKAFSNLGFPFPGVTNPNAKEQNTEGGSDKEVSDAPCFCPVCFNYDTFEKVLNGKPGAKFDYAKVTLGGKEFNIKFYDGPYGENMIIAPNEFKIDPDWTTDTLIGQLNNAVAQKDFNKAQILLNELNNRKNS